MGIETKDKDIVLNTLEKYNILLDSSILNDLDFILKMKYEFMRFDVKSNLDYYFVIE